MLVLDEIGVRPAVRATDEHTGTQVNANTPSLAQLHTKRAFAKKEAGTKCFEMYSLSHRMSLAHAGSLEAVTSGSVGQGDCTQGRCPDPAYLASRPGSPPPAGHPPSWRPSLTRSLSVTSQRPKLPGLSLCHSTPHSSLRERHRLPPGPSASSRGRAVV